VSRRARITRIVAIACLAALAGIAAPARPSDAWRARLSKRLLALYESARAGEQPSAQGSAIQGTSPAAPAGAPSLGSPRLDATGRVQVDVHYDCDTAALSAELTSAGLSINAATHVPPFCVIEGWIAPDALPRLASIAGVSRVSVPSYALPRRPLRPSAPVERTAPRITAPRDKAPPQATAAGPIDGNGVSIMRADQFVAQTRTSGTGVTIGVQSTGVASLSVIQQRGELPFVQVITPAGQSSPPLADEGTALLEEIHAVAPGASLAFCGPETFVEYTACLGQLVAAGATILTDDVIFPGEDIMTAESSSAQAIEQILARNPAVALFTSAGNYNGSYWEGAYAPVSLASQGLATLSCPAGSATQTDAYVAEFNGSPSEQLTVTQSGQIPLVFAWADPADQNVSNFDVYWINNADPTQTGCFSTAGVSANLITPNPTLAAGTYTLYVATPDASLTGKFLKLWIGGDGLTSISAATPGSIVSAQAFASGVITVGAVNGSDGVGNTIETFSSLGPLTLALPAPTEVQAPTLVAPDGIRVDATGTYFAGFLFPDGNFYGTSAAAPNAAAVAALLRGAFPSLTVPQLLTALQTGAVKLGTAPPDGTFGYGRVDALGALATLPAPTITSLPDATVDNGSSTAAYPFAVSGTGNLHFTVTSSDATLVPASIVAAGSPGVTISPATCGTGASSCTLVVTAARGYGGSTNLTVSALDGANRAAVATMKVNVNGPPEPSTTLPPPGPAAAGAGGGGGGGAFGWPAIAALILVGGLRALRRGAPTPPFRPAST
jgi:hypothetical protein